MERILINSEKDLNKYKKILKQVFDAGGTIVFPSDTCYGLAANPSLPSSIEKVYKIKKRELDKQISCIFQSVDQIKDWTILSDLNEKYLKDYLPGAYTFVLKPNEKYPLNGSTVGVRIPNNSITSTLSSIFDSPYTSTSANISGLPSTYNVNDLIEQLRNTTIKPDIILDAGELALNPPSTVVDLTQNPPKILRQGSANFSVE